MLLTSETLRHWWKSYPVKSCAQTGAYPSMTQWATVTLVRQPYQTVHNTLTSTGSLWRPVLQTCILSPALLHTVCLSLESLKYSAGLEWMYSLSEVSWAATSAPLLGRVMIFQGLDLPSVIMGDLQPSAAGASVLPCIFIYVCVCVCMGTG